MKIPKTIYTFKSNLYFAVGMVAFVLLFAIIYTPNYGLSEEALSLSDLTQSHAAMMQWYTHQGLALPICCAIMLGVVALSRTLMLLTTRTARITEGEYFWWQLGEVLVTALFLNLFLSLLLRLNYFQNLPLVLMVYLSVAIYPYAFYWLLAERMDRDVRLAEAQRTILHLRRREAEENTSMLRLADDRGTVRLVVSTESVISIEAASNYVTILYLSSSRLTRYSLRNTLRGIEQQLEGTPLVRCHRSYYINLNHIKLLRKQADGLVAEIDEASLPDLPISKSFAPTVMERFAASATAPRSAPTPTPTSHV